MKPCKRKQLWRLNQHCKTSRWGKNTHPSKHSNLGEIRYFNKKNPYYWQTRGSLKKTLEIISSASACFETHWNCGFILTVIPCFSLGTQHNSFNTSCIPEQWIPTFASPGVLSTLNLGLSNATSFLHHWTTRALLQPQHPATLVLPQALTPAKPPGTWSMG